MLCLCSALITFAQIPVLASTSAITSIIKLGEQTITLNEITYTEDEFLKLLETAIELPQPILALPLYG